MKRRQFLRAALGASAAVAGFSLGNLRRPGFNVAEAAEWNGKTLIIVYQRGGCDGLNTVVPHGYAATGLPPDDPSARYYDIRPTIAIAKPGETGGALDLGGGVGLHPALSSFETLFLDGNLAVMPAVHYDNASRSHFSSQQYTESAISNLSTDGWLNRHLQTSTNAFPMRAVGIGNDLPHTLRGSEVVSVFSDLRSFEMGISNAADEQEVLARLQTIYNQSPDSSKYYSDMYHDFSRVTLSDLAVVSALKGTPLDPDTYDTGGSVPYPNTTFGRQMKQTAILVKAGVGLEVASLNIGGWDTHGNQGGAAGNHANRLTDFSNGIHALFDDLSAANMMDEVLILSLTEFGRTSKENGSLGTDHAHAAAWFAAGTTNTLNGGVYLGKDKTTVGGYPDGNAITDWISHDPLDPAKMVRDRYLDHTIDYRDIYGEILEKFIGNTNYGTLLPGHGYSAGDGPGILV